MLEISNNYHPARLGALLHQPVYSYANVPYRIKSFESLLEDAKDTVVYDEESGRRIAQRLAEKGADGRLILDREGEVEIAQRIEAGEAKVFIALSKEPALLELFLILQQNPALARSLSGTIRARPHSWIAIRKSKCGSGPH